MNPFILIFIFPPNLVKWPQRHRAKLFVKKISLCVLVAKMFCHKMHKNNTDGSVKSPNLELLPPYIVVAKELFMDYIVVAQIISDFLRVHQGYWLK
jgi:hypothetical protein